MTGGSALESEAGGATRPEESSDEVLAMAVREGDRGALEVLVRRYLRPVHAVVASFLRDADEIEDAAQEAFLRALRGIERYDPDRPFAPWLYQIARNVARNRQGMKSRWALERLPQEGLQSADPDPEVAMERTEIRERVEAELARLPEQRRTAFRLVDVEGMQAEEAGRIMGLAPGTIRSHLHHARHALRASLIEFAEVPPPTGE